MKLRIMLIFLLLYNLSCSGFNNPNSKKPDPSSDNYIKEKLDIEQAGIISQKVLEQNGSKVNPADLLAVSVVVTDYINGSFVIIAIIPGNKLIVTSDPKLIDIQIVNLDSNIISNPSVIACNDNGYVLLASNTTVAIFKNDNLITPVSTFKSDFNIEDALINGDNSVYLCSSASIKVSDIYGNTQNYEALQFGDVLLQGIRGIDLYKNELYIINNFGKEIVCLVDNKYAGIAYINPLYSISDVSVDEKLVYLLSRSKDEMLILNRTTLGLVGNLTPMNWPEPWGSVSGLMTIKCIPSVDLLFIQTNDKIIMMKESYK